MSTLRQGSIRLFRFAGADVFLHWSWFFVALFEINGRAGTYSSVTWNVLEYLALFLIVLLHEYGHALACRQVGGTADQIVLWPMGGVAYVDPPPGPGPHSGASLPAAGECCAASAPDAARLVEPMVGVVTGNAQFPPVASGDLVDQPLPAAVSTSCQSIPWMAARFFDPYSRLSWDAPAA
jgi:Zn-dependent protease